ncbi:hypothetical protein GCM10007875_13730 [Limnobacter litoralis]|uniref:RHS repeat protein n=2 Tax=Limnobacter litoralis TaxID=481366 RepID=A0ABQ5YU33_9BURK|nr:hypothetical protein GCM10007875_13730 [Limnobacter litoralis]
MSQFISLSANPLPSTKKLLVREFPNRLWLFVGASVQLSPWLLLHRIAHSNVDLEMFLSFPNAGYGTNKSNALEIAQCFELFDVHARNHPQGRELIDLVEDALASAQIRAVRLPDNADNYANLLKSNSFFWVATEDGQASGNSITQLENKLIIELGGLMVARWAAYDKEQANLVHQSWLAKAKLYGGAVLEGGKKGAQGFVKGLDDLAEVVVSAPHGIAQAVGNFHFDISKSDFEQLQKNLIVAGYGFFNSDALLRKALEQGIYILNILFRHPRIFQAIYLFILGQGESTSLLMALRGGSEGVVRICLELALALSTADLTAAAGTALKVGSNAAKAAVAGTETARKVSEMVGPFSRHAIDLMTDLYRLIVKPTSAVEEVSTAGQAAESVSVLKSAAKAADKEANMARSAEKTVAKAEKTAGANARCAANTCTGGEPIDMFTGAELLQLTDFALQGNISLPWQRTYRSNQLKNTGMGCGWASPISQRLFARQHAGKAQMVLLDQEGREIYFDWPQGCIHAVNPHEQLELQQKDGLFMVRSSAATQNPDSHIERHFQPQSEVAAGQWVLARYQDPHGNAIHFHYDQSPSGLPVRISNTEGREIRLHWQDGLLTSVQSGQQTLASYTYTLGEDKRPDLASAADALGQAEHYTYQHHVFATRSLKTGYTFHFEWEGQGESARCVQQWGDPVHGQATYHYRFEWNPAARQSAVIDTRGGRTTYQFNAQGLPLQITDPEGGIVQFEYDEYGRLLRQTDPLGNTDLFAYDAQGRLLSHTNKAGHIRTFENSDTLLPTEYKGHRYTYTAQGLVQSHTDPAGRTTRYVWNNKGQLQAVRTPTGQHIRYQHTEGGGFSNVAAIVAPNAHGQESIQRFEYDALGQCTAVTSPQGQTTRYQYNAQGLLTSIANAHQRLEYAYNGLSQVEHKALYQGDKLVSKLHYHYDGERNLIGLTNEKGERYHLKYDQAERLIEEQGFDGRTRRYQYNRAGHLLASMEVDPNPKTPAALQVLARTQYKRNALGQVLELVAIDHCALGQLHSGTTQSTSQFEYDALGRLSTARNAHTRLQFAYNDDGQLAQEKQGDLTLTHTYNALGQRTQTTLEQPQGEGTQQEAITYQWDESPTGTAQLQTMAYNGQQLLGLQHNDLGLETARTHSNQLCTESQYDPRGRLLEQRTLKERTLKQSAIIERRYHYDAQGRIGQIDDLLRGTTQYHYDPLSRLKSVQGPVPEQFLFDPASNLLGMIDAEQSDQISQPPQPAATGNRLAMQGDQHFSYDALGRRTEKRWGKGQRFRQAYRYNAHSQLALVQTKGEQTRYQYDPLGRRILKVSEDDQTRFYWLGDCLLKEVQTSAAKGNESSTYLFEPEQGNGESFKPVAVVKTDAARPEGAVYHIHTDHLGTPQEVSNAEGQIIWAAQYRAYGALKRQLKVAGSDVHVDDHPDRSFTQNLRFMGQYFDEETGLHYNRHRYYDPECGQFTTQDPIGLMGGLNNYQYVPNPVSWVDPLGLVCEVYHFNMVENPGPLASLPGSPAANFAGGKYNQKVLQEDTIYYRGGASGGR